MKRKLVKIIFWLLKKVDKQLYYEIYSYLDDAECGYQERIKMIEKNNEYNKIKLNKRFEMLQIAKIKEIKKRILLFT